MRECMRTEAKNNNDRDLAPFLLQPRNKIVDLHDLLYSCITITDGHLALIIVLGFDTDRIWHTYLLRALIPFSDRPGLIVFTCEVFREEIIESIRWF